MEHKKKKDKYNGSGFGTPEARKGFVRGFKKPGPNPFTVIKEFFSPSAEAAEKKKKSY